MSQQLRVVVLCSDEPHNVYLTLRIAEAFDLRAVVVEPGDAQVSRRLHRKQYRDWLYLRYHGLRRQLLGLSAYRRTYFACPDPAPTIRHQIVDDVNAPEVVALLERQRPDVTVVICTSVLRRKVLEAAGPVIINVHGGFLPHYKGNHCFFFALLAGDFDRIGSTLHFIDSGVDTGNIIEQVRPPLVPDDNAETLYCRAERLAIDRLIEHLKAYESGQPLPRRPQDKVGRQYLTRDRGPLDELRMWWRRWSGQLVIPHRAAAGVAKACPPARVIPPAFERPRP